MDRVMQHNVLAMSGKAVEASGDIQTLLLDKTGTVTLGNREAVEFIPFPGVTPKSWPTPPNSPASLTKPPKAVPSLSLPKRIMASVAAKSPNMKRISSRSPPTLA